MLGVMSWGLVFILVMIAMIIVYTIAVVIRYNRQSQRQWEQADKSKLKEWEEDDDWD